MSSCSSCHKQLGKNQEVVTASSGLKFHRFCLEQLINAKPDITDEVCGKKTLSFSMHLLG
jgi:hypothetical protein